MALSCSISKVNEAQADPTKRGPRGSERGPSRYTAAFQTAVLNRNAAFGKLCPKERRYCILHYSNPVLFKLFVFGTLLQTNCLTELLLRF